MLILVTGATGKVGRMLIARLLADPAFGATPASAPSATTAPLPETDRRRGRAAAASPTATTVEAAMEGVTHVVHLATCKETPEDVMDVTVKGLFWLLEAFRAEPGRAALRPDRRRCRRRPFPLPPRRPGHRGDAAHGLSRLLRALQGARGGDARAVRHPVRPRLDCCLRAPWIMEKDDFRYTLSLRRRRLRRPRLEDAGRPRGRRAAPSPKAPCRCSTTPTARRSSATSSMSTTSLRRS